jgi:hypothetical protein
VRPENVKRRKRGKINPGQNFRGRIPFPAMPTCFLFLTYLIFVPQHHQTTCSHNRVHFQVSGSRQTSSPILQDHASRADRKSTSDTSAHSTEHLLQQNPQSEMIKDKYFDSTESLDNERITSNIFDDLTLTTFMNMNLDSVILLLKVD